MNDVYSLTCHLSLLLHPHDNPQDSIRILAIHGPPPQLPRFLLTSISNFPSFISSAFLSSPVDFPSHAVPLDFPSSSHRVHHTEYNNSQPPSPPTATSSVSPLLFHSHFPFPHLHRDHRRVTLYAHHRSLMLSRAAAPRDIG